MTNLTEEYRKLEQDFFAYQKMLNEANKDLNKYYLENTKLKELLKRIGKELNDCPTCVEGSWKAELVDKIDQVLANNQIQANTVACNKIQENE